MTTSEKIYLVEVLLEDLRNNWAYRVSSRMDLAYRLCGELVDKDDRFLQLGETIRLWDRSDGRYFRDDFPNGYENMYELHKLDRNLKNKSIDFQNYVAMFVTYPEYRFADVANPSEITLSSRVLYRPHRGSLEQSMADMEVFTTVDGMYNAIVSYWKGMIDKSDLSVSRYGHGVDDRVGWHNLYVVCTARMGDDTYDTPQCIGFCNLPYGTVV